jgi:hypothetical protein
MKKLTEPMYMTYSEDSNGIVGSFNYDADRSVVDNSAAKMAELLGRAQVVYECKIVSVIKPSKEARRWRKTRLLK